MNTRHPGVLKMCPVWLESCMERAISTDFHQPDCAIHSPEESGTWIVASFCVEKKNDFLICCFNMLLANSSFILHPSYLVMLNGIISKYL